MPSEQHVSSTRVWFGDDVGEGASQLFVETPDRLGVLFAVVSAIIRARVKILKSNARIAEGLAHDWFLVADAGGGPVGPARRDLVRTQVLAAVVSAWQPGPASGPQS